MPNVEQSGGASIVCQEIIVGGQVQAVGFRPFVYRLAGRHGIHGWVRNEKGLVRILAEGRSDALVNFLEDLVSTAPPLARPVIISVNDIPPGNFQGFSIAVSGEGMRPNIHVPPDYFVCNDCLREMHDPKDRRYGYPFINCTQCGPRYTLIRQLPYDRPNTTMAGFQLCPSCQNEYRDPANRRFHAEPLACPECGPQIKFVAGGETTIGTDEAMEKCLSAFRAGKIVAIKGIGGYHLMCDARNDGAVARLRSRKFRPHKPLAVMFPMEGERGMHNLKQYIVPTPEEMRLLAGPMRPVVLVKRNENSGLSSLIAPGLQEVGAMLPYSPLHELLLSRFDAPLVATSGNISGEPVLTKNNEAASRLASVADGFLLHNRPIQRPADDPVFRILGGREHSLRLGRGASPLELSLPFRLKAPLLAVGGHMKNTVALAWDDRVVVSPHIGDLGSLHSLKVFEQVIADLQSLYDVRAELALCDAHPGYGSTEWAKQSGLPVVNIFHHHAHASGLVGEFPDLGQWIMFTWDGVGLGEDGTLWGGESFVGTAGQWRRFGTMHPFRLPGGEKASRDPWRSAVAMAWEAGMEWKDFAADEEMLRHAWKNQINSPVTTAVGRLFDGAASMLGLCNLATFEGQAPMVLENMMQQTDYSVELPLAINGQGLWETDWKPLVPLLLDQDKSSREQAAIFHGALVNALVAQSLKAREQFKINCVGLTGGVFQNRHLVEGAMAVLDDHGFEVMIPEQVPCNDGGLCFGQVIEYGSMHHG